MKKLLVIGILSLTTLICNNNAFAASHAFCTDDDGDERDFDCCILNKDGSHGWIDATGAKSSVCVEPAYPLGGTNKCFVGMAKPGDDYHCNGDD